MKSETEQQGRERRLAACDRLRGTGFYPVGGWLFMKDGKIYDLSAADLDQLDRIEREGLFVRNDVTNENLTEMAALTRNRD